MKSINDKKGFTLVEAIIVFTLVAILSFGMANFIVTLMRGWVLISSRDAAAGKARAAMNRMLTEIRRTKKPQNITTYTTAELQFLDLSSQTIDYKQTGTNLMRNSDILATNLVTPEGLRFTYLGSTGEVTAVKNNIRTIRIWLSLYGGTERITLESAARIRNL
ncbi:MAG: prepilin-type N-terminal cleavage/methylation domain-containing protein [Candidatus Margulisiibacteriota bacterium]